ncbi:MAG: response regulator [Chloroflexota bacterium]|nr:response regulator [Chloroflexota bacterium]
MDISMSEGNSNPLALIVEDDPDAAAIFSEALKAAGFEVEIIWAGDKALERLTVTTPAVVVLDMHLPHVAGPDILHYIRADARLAETRVIIATADPSMADAINEEVTLILLKPISFSQLRDMAKRLR